MAIDGRAFCIEFRDTLEDEYYISSSRYMNVAVVVFVAAKDIKDSFDSLSGLKSFVDRYCKTSHEEIFVVNKSDLPSVEIDDGVVSRALDVMHGEPFLFTSATTPEGVEPLYQMIIDRVLPLIPAPPPPPQSPRLHEQPKKRH